MNEEKRIKCRFCSELIFPNAKKCRFCGEWFEEKGEVVEEVAQSSSVDGDSSVVDEVLGHEGGGGFRWGLAIRVSLVLFYVALIVVGVFYEAKAREVLDYARDMEGKKKYEVAYLAYQVVAKKYSLSYVVSDAMIGISRIDVDSLSFDLPEIGATFFERLSGGRFDSCYHYGLPLVASVICFLVGGLMVLVRIFQLRWPLFAFFLVVFSALFFIVQATAYNWIGIAGSFFDVSVKIMRSYELVYVAGYVLLFVTAVETFCGSKK